MIDSTTPHSDVTLFSDIEKVEDKEKEKDKGKGQKKKKKGNSKSTEKSKDKKIGKNFLALTSIGGINENTMNLHFPKKDWKKGGYLITAGYNLPWIDLGPKIKQYRLPVRIF